MIVLSWGILKVLLVISLGLLFNGCLYSTHHFNTGETLKAGRSKVTIGAGRQPLWDCLDKTPRSSILCNGANGNPPEPVSVSQTFKGSVNYKLGLKDNWGPFPKTELQWHFEAPTNPITMEFGLVLGLPDFNQQKFSHNLHTGWGMGIWSDNSFFLEYALSRSVYSHRLFINLRETWLATQINDVLNENFDKELTQNKQFISQIGIGLQLKLPDWFLMPHFISPQLNFTFPQVTTGDFEFLDADIDDYLANLNIATSWVF